MMFTEGILGSERKMLMHRRADDQKASSVGLTQKAESLLNVQGKNVLQKEVSDSKEQLQPSCRAYQESLLHKNRVLSLLKNSRIRGNKEISISSPTYSSAGSLMSTAHHIASIQLGELDIDFSATIDILIYYRVGLNDNHRKLSCEEIKDLKAFIWTCNRDFKYWRQRQDGNSSKESAHAIGSLGRPNQECRTSQLLEHKRWRPNNQPSSSYAGRNLRQGFVRSWNNATRFDSPRRDRRADNVMGTPVVALYLVISASTNILALNSSPKSGPTPHYDEQNVRI